jgi:hypothetical protein
MKPKKLTKQLCDWLKASTMIRAEVGDPIFVTGDDLENLRLNLIEESKENTINRAGVYIIGNEEDVIRVGEGGKGKDDTGGTMGHRVFQHIAKQEWMKQASVVCFIPIHPGQYSRLGEQMALACYFQNKQRLPEHNKAWR